MIKMRRSRSFHKINVFGAIPKINYCTKYHVPCIQSGHLLSFWCDSEDLLLYKVPCTMSLVWMLNEFLVRFRRSVAVQITMYHVFSLDA